MFLLIKSNPCSLDSFATSKHHALMSELERIVTQVEQANAQHDMYRSWQPRHTGTINIRIAADGCWFHEGRPFQRLSLVKLFAGILQRQGKDYFLSTPTEKLQIQVDDAPFVATLVETVIEDDQPAIVFTTNLGNRIIVDADHPIWVETDPQTQIPRPYVHYRDGLHALISRNAFFELTNLATERKRDGKMYLIVNSLGHEFELGCAEPMEYDPPSQHP